MSRSVGVLLAVGLLACGMPAWAAESQAVIDLGQALFHDPNLSLQRTQSCASCHSSQQAFTDGRRDSADGAVSLGADGVSRGRRNAPTLTYAAFAPAFRRDELGYLGGQFYDGRAATLLQQVEGPLFDVTEMAMPDAATIAARLRERPDYLAVLMTAFEGVSGDDDDALYRAALRAIVAFERSETFAAFDSRYDRYLAGEYTMTREEMIGRELFFSDLANCHSCHLQDPQRRSVREPFSSYRYFNIGVPANPELAAAGQAADPGLAGHPDVSDPRQRGKFRVPTLRNVAVTGPYMHNGVFQDLETAVRFYGRYVVANDYSETNPETGAPWGTPEVDENIDFDRLSGGQPIGPIRVRQLVAFLRTLTDQRYEHLLQ